MNEDAEVAYAPLTEVAAAYGVSVDTIRRRLRRGEIEGRKETTPQGFRWVAALPEGREAGSSVVVTHIENAAQVELVATLQRELDLRNQEISQLHEVIERQAVALEHATSALPQLPARVSSAVPHEPQPDQAAPAASAMSLWERLRRLIKG